MDIALLYEQTHRKLRGDILHSYLFSFFPAWITADDIEQEVWERVCRNPQTDPRAIRRRVMIDILREVRRPRLYSERIPSEEEIAIRLPHSLSEADLDTIGADDPDLCGLESREILHRLWGGATAHERTLLGYLANGVTLRTSGKSDTWNSISKRRLRIRLRKLLAV